jgi:glutamine amidotransferase
MCELFALSCNDKDRATKGLPVFQQRGSWCQDGWGIGWYDGPTSRVVKSGEDVNVSERFFKAVDKAKSNVIVAHVRSSTGGAADTCNSHPFKIHAVGRDWLFAHNGDVPHIVSQEYPSRVKPYSDIDSARIFSFLVDEMERYLQGATIRGMYPAVVRATRTLIERFGGSVNYLLTDGLNLFILNHYPGTPIYFIRRGKPYGSAFVATTVCRLTNERWRTLPPDRVLVVSNGDFLVLSDPIV